MKRKNRMTPDGRKRRKHWVSALAKLSGSFGDDTTKMIADLHAEIARSGTEALLDHLRLCGAMPEHYGRDWGDSSRVNKRKRRFRNAELPLQDPRFHPGTHCQQQIDMRKA